MPNRPTIPAEVSRQVFIEAGHRCAVCGTPVPLERAHIIPWHRTRDHSAENLICLCANCHQRADQEKWDTETLRQYKERPWVHRNYDAGGPPPSVPSSAGRAPLLCTELFGRDDALSEMRARLTEAPTTVLTAVRGWPGVGKTTLATALAHDTEVNKALSDGVLWAALGPDADPMPVLGSWLTALGVSPHDMPSAEDRCTRLAALLRNRRMLLIIDDVWDASQARLLCVGGRDCRTVITTRHPEVARALGLAEQAVYHLDVLSEDASLALLRDLAPAAVDMDPDGTRRLVQELEGLPLALKVAGGLLAAESGMGWGIGDLLAELTEGRRILQEQVPADLTDLASQTRPTVAILLHKSTDRLDDLNRDRFALLGAFVPKPATFDEPAAGALWEVDDPRPTLRLLADRGLLEPAGGGRFQMHALLAVHAQALCDE